MGRLFCLPQMLFAPILGLAGMRKERIMYVVLARGSWGMRIVSQTAIRSEAMNAIGRALVRADIKSLVIRAGSREYEVDVKRPVLPNM